MNKRVKQSAKQTLQTIVNLLPIIIGMLLLTSLAVTILPQAISAGLFGDHAFFDVLLGALIGSVAVGQPLASYILGGELLDGGVSLLAVTALIVSWVTVGVVQSPAEALLQGRGAPLLPIHGDRFSQNPLPASPVVCVQAQFRGGVAGLTDMDQDTLNGIRLGEERIDL